MGITSINPYGQGGKVLNSTPYLQYFMQTRAHEQAKNAALENHFSKLNESINPAGVRNQDIDGFVKRVNENRDFYLQNKKAIQDPTADNGKAYSEYMSRHQAALGFVNSSKQAAAVSKQVAPLFMNIQTRERLAPKTFDDYQAHDLPLDKGHKTFDLAGIQVDPKPFDTDAQSKYLTNRFKDIPTSETFAGTTRDPNTLQIINTTKKGYNKDAALAIADMAKKDWYSNPSIHKFVNDSYGDPAQEGQAHGRLNDLFKRYTGKDIQDKGDLWAAIVLEQKMQESIKQTPISDWKAKNSITHGEAIALKNMSKADQKEMIRYKKSYSDAGKATTPAEGIAANGGFDIEDHKTADGGIIKDGIAINAKGQPHEGVVTIPVSKVNSNISAAINALDKDNSIKVDKETGLATFKTDKDGRLIGVMTRSGIFKLGEQVAGSKKAAGVSTKNRSGYTGTTGDTPTVPKKTIRKSKANPLGLDLP
jgi:hypothetical protein